MSTLYAGVDIDVPIELTGVTVAQISAITVGLYKDGASVASKSLAGGITVEDGDFVMRIDAGDVTESGLYRLFCTITDIDGDYHGLRPNPEILVFELNPLVT